MQMNLFIVMFYNQSNFFIVWNMNTKQIEILLTVGETLNFTKAADILYMSQPSLSYQIQEAEKEIRFKIFDRSQKSISITPAGKSFLENLRNIHSLYQSAVEEGQNYSEKFDDEIVISLPYRSAIHLLPEAMIAMEKTHPTTLITPKFGWSNRLNSFLSGEVDLLFDDYDVIKNIQGVDIMPLYQSRIYLVCNKTDPLAKKPIIEMNDLLGRTLMVSGGSQRNLKTVQQRVLDSTHIPFFNSNDHDTTLTNIAAGKAIVLAPGFLHDRNGGFAWVPFDCEECIECCIAKKEEDQRKTVSDFLSLLKSLYSNIKEGL